VADIESILIDNGGAVEHHFAGGIYAKETHIPAGVVLTQHEHPHDHLSILAKGDALLVVDGIEIALSGPKCLNIPAGRKHSVKAVSNIVWFCIWPEGV
jgi:quercetin dioxygenase-like cupin family protein